MLRADSATVAWNAEKKHWEVRIQIGEEVIKRAIDLPREQTAAGALSAKAVEIAKDEGYDLNPANVSVHDTAHAA